MCQFLRTFLLRSKVRPLHVCTLTANLSSSCSTVPPPLAFARQIAGKTVCSRTLCLRTNERTEGKEVEATFFCSSAWCPASRRYGVTAQHLGCGGVTYSPEGGGAAVQYVRMEDGGKNIIGTNQPCTHTYVHTYTWSVTLCQRAFFFFFSAFFSALVSTHSSVSVQFPYGHVFVPRATT